MNTKMTVKQIRIRRDLIRIRLKFEFLSSPPIQVSRQKKSPCPL